MKPFDYLAYIWEVEFSDGTFTCQFEKDGTEHRWSEIPQEHVIKFTWVPTREGLVPHTILISSEQKLNCYRKNFISMINGSHKVAFVIGVHGQPLKWIFEDDVLMEELK